MSMELFGSPSTNATVLSPSSAACDPRVQLPTTTDPPSPNNPPKQLVWLIFGATGHMGRSLVKAALVHNDLVAAVGRTFEDSHESMQKMQIENENCMGLLCDVRVRETVQEVIERAIAHFGRVDIVVNCSGYGVIGACEDQDDFDIRNQFETNFMGTLNIIQLSLPHFRQRKAGRYVIFSSTSGALGVPGLGPYCASKYAVEGLIESMLHEVDSFNIKLALIEPGHVRRDDIPTPMSPSPLDNPQQSSHLPAYGHFSIKHTSEPYRTNSSPAAHARRLLLWFGDKQPVSAVKAAELVWQLGHCSFPPLRLLLGTYAVESIRDRLRCITEEIEDWKHLNFPLPGQEVPSNPDVESRKSPASKSDENEEEPATG